MTFNDRQQRVLLAIEVFNREHPYPPSIRDIQAAADLSSTSVVLWHLRALRARGLVDWTPGVARSIRLVKSA